MSNQLDFAGSWRVMATDPETTELSLGTYGADGTVVTSPRPVVPPFGPSEEPIYTSAGHGAWAATGPDTGVATFVVLTADRLGNESVTVTVHASVAFGADRQTFTGEGSRTFADPAGNTVGSQPVTVEGTRIVADASPA